MTKLTRVRFTDKKKQSLTIQLVVIVFLDKQANLIEIIKKKKKDKKNIDSSNRLIMSILEVELTNFLYHFLMSSDQSFFDRLMIA